MRSDTVDRASVEKMVRSFYETVMHDALVGPYFIRALGSDLKNDKWYEHFRTLVNFWLFMMEGEEGYRGDPFVPHAFIGELDAETFARWLVLFSDHVHHHFTPGIAEKFYKKAEILADRFMINLEIE